MFKKYLIKKQERDFENRICNLRNRVDKFESTFWRPRKASIDWLERITDKLQAKITSLDNRIEIKKNEISKIPRFNLFGTEDWKHRHERLNLENLEEIRSDSNEALIFNGERLLKLKNKINEESFLRDDADNFSGEIRAWEINNILNLSFEKLDMKNNKNKSLILEEEYFSSFSSQYMQNNVFQEADSGFIVSFSNLSNYFFSFSDFLFNPFYLMDAYLTDFREFSSHFPQLNITEPEYWRFYYKENSPILNDFDFMGYYKLQSDKNNIKNFFLNDLNIFDIDLEGERNYLNEEFGLICNNSNITTDEYEYKSIYNYETGKFEGSYTKKLWRKQIIPDLMKEENIINFWNSSNLRKLRWTKGFIESYNSNRNISKFKYLEKKNKTVNFLFLTEDPKLVKQKQEQINIWWNENQNEYWEIYEGYINLHKEKIKLQETYENRKKIILFFGFIIFCFYFWSYIKNFFKKIYEIFEYYYFTKKSEAFKYYNFINKKIIKSKNNINKNEVFEENIFSENSYSEFSLLYNNLEKAIKEKNWSILNSKKQLDEIRKMKKIIKL